MNEIRIIPATETGSATGYLRALPTRKEQIEMFVRKITDDIIESGNYNPLQAWVEITNIEKSLEKIKENIKQSAIKEREKYGKEEALYGAKISVIEAGTKYDYTECNDAKWNALESESKRIADEKKAREKFLKSIPKDQQLTDEDTGFIIVAPTKKSTTTLKVE